MASGGARGNAGRIPDPNALRRDRSGDAASWETLENPTFDAPEFPLDTPSDRELSVWAKLWKKPQATKWLELGLEDEVALYCRYFVEAEAPDGRGAVRTLVKQHQELLGLSTAGMTRLRWKMPLDAEVKTQPVAAPRKSSSRARLKVVGGND